VGTLAGDAKRAVDADGAVSATLDAAANTREVLEQLELDGAVVTADHGGMGHVGLLYRPPSLPRWRAVVASIFVEAIREGSPLDVTQA
jgi:hypothetical protein